ncbi:MAG: hypothetical protein AAGH92_11570, partial [Planctomycetota bacterium]
ASRSGEGYHAWIDRYRTCPVRLGLRLAGVVAIVSGLIGGWVWGRDIASREVVGGVEIFRWGFYHNPRMQFPPFHEGFLDLSMALLFWGAAATGLGGLLLLIPWKWAVPLVTWPARMAIVLHAVTAFFVVATVWLVLPIHRWGQWYADGWTTALGLRMVAVLVDFALWGFLSSKAVRAYFRLQAERKPYTTRPPR